MLCLIAARAYKQAMSTLATLAAHPPAHTFDPSLAAANPSAQSIFSSLLPNLQGQGPIGSAVRIVLKLHQNVARRISNFLGRDSLKPGHKRKEDEIRGKAIKVIDLFQHSAELGNMEALYMLGQISLVSTVHFTIVYIDPEYKFPPSRHFPSDPVLAFNSLSAHAERTGNASSQSLLAFYHGTGYGGVVPLNQAKAQLYYTFAANGGDKGAQMALGYRYWSGIGTSESCERAVGWYGAASEKGECKSVIP